MDTTPVAWDDVCASENIFFKYIISLYISNYSRAIYIVDEKTYIL